MNGLWQRSIAVSTMKGKKTVENDWNDEDCPAWESYKAPSGSRVDEAR